MAQIEAGGADRGRWDRSQPVARIADEYGDGIRARTAVDGGEFHLNERGRLAYRPVDHCRTISIPISTCGHFTQRGGLKSFHLRLVPFQLSLELSEQKSRNERPLLESP
jgi:hypothetical protein